MDNQLLKKMISAEEKDEVLSNLPTANEIEKEIWSQIGAWAPGPIVWDVVRFVESEKEIGEEIVWQIALRQVEVLKLTDTFKSAKEEERAEIQQRMVTLRDALDDLFLEIEESILATRGFPDMPWIIVPVKGNDSSNNECVYLLISVNVSEEVGQSWMAAIVGEENPLS